MSYVLRLHLRRPDGGTYNIENRISREGINEKTNTVMLHAEQMRKKAEHEIKRQGWDNARTDLEEGGFGMPDEYHPHKVPQTLVWHRVNQKITFHPNEAYADGFFEPLDELRMEIAKWLQATQEQ